MNFLYQTQSRQIRGIITSVSWCKKKYIFIFKYLDGPEKIYLYIEIKNINILLKGIERNISPEVSVLFFFSFTISLGAKKYDNFLLMLTSNILFQRHVTYDFRYFLLFFISFFLTWTTWISYISRGTRGKIDWC